ncbi:MAG: glycosyltransferase family 4 protein [Proteobacteria bacterium]|nr:glycosyltransferase family 4 protein [Pseudomonadota bacterium]
MRKLYGIPEERIHVIWNGSEPPQPDVSPEILALLPADGTPVICSISTLIPQKGLEDLIRAMAIVRDAGRRFRLLLIGEGRLRGALQDLTTRLGLQESIQLLGWVNDASRRALPACDIFVQSSHWEAMSVVILEAMAAAKPIVATAVGENGRVMENNMNGLLVPPGDPPAFAAAMLRLLDDQALRTRLGLAAQSRFRETLTIEQMIRRHEDLYSRLLDARQGRPT